MGFNSGFKGLNIQSFGGKAMQTADVAITRPSLLGLPQFGSVVFEDASLFWRTGKMSNGAKSGLWGELGRTPHCQLVRAMSCKNSTNDDSKQRLDTFAQKNELQIILLRLSTIQYRRHCSNDAEQECFFFRL